MSVTALVLAAGEGTRMKSKTPKVLHTVLGVSMLDLVLQSAADAGCGRRIVVVGHEGDKVAAALGEGVETITQEHRIGTANAVSIARDIVLSGGPTGDIANYLLVLSGDVPLLRPETLAELVSACKDAHAAASILTATLDDPFGYGRILRDSYGHISGIVEEKDATEEQKLIREINTGIYCFAIDGLFDRLEQIKNDNAQGEYYLPDVFPLLVDEGLAVVGLEVADSTEAGGVNSRVQLAEATALLRKRINAKWMVAGVTMIAPELTWISPMATLERDVTILPNTHIMGASVIEEDAILGPDSRIVNSHIKTGAHVDSSIVVDSVVGERAEIGPRSYLRPGNILEARTKVGTSVELKNTLVGVGTKIPHLSYIGDAIIGEHSNLGAGTITCNYDGYEKSKTIIGDNVFIGSDTMLIAPVTIGNGAATGASSAICMDVPADALAIERSDQRIIPEWAAKKRASKTTAAE